MAKQVTWAIALTGLALGAAAAAPAWARSVPAAVAPTGGAATLAQVNAAAGKPVQLGKKVLVSTTKGNFTITLFPKASPKTVENFLKLVAKKFYDGTTFHRVIPGFVAQGGDPLSRSLPAGNPRIGTGDPGYSIQDEHGNGLKHLIGSVAMAHSSAPNSAGSQFYICYSALAQLDGGYTVFGHVTEGFANVAKITPTEQGGMPTPGVKPDKMITLKAL